MTSNLQRKLSIAFVAGNKNPNKFRQDPAYIYRCENPARALSEQGVDVSLIHYTKLFQQKCHYDLVIFHRPSARNRWHYWPLLRAIKRLKRAGSVLVADFDDLVFDPQYAHLSPGYINQLVSLKQTQKNFASHTKVLRHFNCMTVSTLPLMHYASAFFNEHAIHHLPNSPYKLWEQYSPSPMDSSQFVIKYLPGTRSHDADFRLVTEPLAEFLAQYPDARLKITGVLDQNRLPATIQKFNSQILWQKKQPFNDYWKVVNDGNVHIAPLENTEFNQCKSALKSIEASYFNRPTIVSPITDMHRLTEAGATLAHSAEEWFSELEKHYKNPSVRPLRDKVAAIYSADKHAEQLLELYEQHQQ